MSYEVPSTLAHTEWLIDTKERLKTEDNKEVEVWEFRHQDDDTILTEWAHHFRNHYCLDTQIDGLCSGTGKSKSEYLRDIKFPDSSIAPGPSIRAGDFSEILTADFLEFILGFWVPRTRYVDKAIRNESTKGSDIIGFLFKKQDKESSGDTLAICESKAQYSGNKPKPRLQDAIDDSGKDVIRKAESLNAIKQKYLDKSDISSVNKIQRFQNEIDHPYKQIYGAVAHWDSSFELEDIIQKTTARKHPYKKNLILIVIKGTDMMRLVHELYRRAADEA